MENFVTIEKHTNTKIILYSLNYGCHINEFEFNLLRKDNNPNMDTNQEIYLCQHLDTNHVFLINIQKYFLLMKNSHKERINTDKEYL